MARKAKEPRVRRSRRERKRKSEPTNDVPDRQRDDAYWGWLNGRFRAKQIIDDRKERPFWLSIEYDGSIPVSGFYPTTMFRRYGRVYYGFLFQEHRDQCFTDFYKLDVRKELTGHDNGPLS